jgi:hypothetical protein
MSTWNVYILGSDGVTWEADDPINRPNENIERMTSANINIVTLADGSEALVSTEVKKRKEPYSLTFLNPSSTLIAQLKAYVDNGDKIKIVTHTGENLIGKILDIHEVWLTGTSPDEYDIQITFKPTE